MSISTQNLYSMNQYDVWNNLGNGGGAAALFNNVPGLNSVWNCSGGSNYMNFFNTGCCNGSGKFNFGGLIGAAIAWFTVMLTNKGVSVYKTQKAEKEAAENQAVTDFNSALTALGYETDDNTILSLTKEKIDNVGPAKKYQDAIDDAKKNLLVDGKDAKGWEDEVTLRQSALDKTNKSISDNEKSIELKKLDLDECEKSSEEYKKLNKEIIELKKQNKELEEKKEKQEAALKEAQGNKDTADKRQTALDDANKAYEKAEEALNPAKTSAKEHLADRQAKIKAERAKELNEKIDKADGNWLSRMGTTNFEVGTDGTITGNPKDMNDKDIKNIGNIFKRGTIEQRDKAKKFVDDNYNELVKRVKPDSDAKVILDSIHHS